MIIKLLFLIWYASAYELQTILNLVVSEKKLNMEANEIIDIIMGSIGLGSDASIASGLNQSSSSNATREFGKWTDGGHQSGHVLFISSQTCKDNLKSHKYECKKSSKYVFFQGQHTNTIRIIEIIERDGYQAQISEIRNFHL